MKSRVEIEGQHIDTTICSSKSRPMIDRNPQSISTAGLRDWNKFCNSVDDALAPLARTKSIFRIYTVVSGIYTSILFAALYLLPLVLDIDPEDNILQTLFPALLFPTAIIFIYLYWQSRQKLTAVMKEVKGVCQNHCASGSGVKYTLETESFATHSSEGGQTNLKSYYIEIEIMDEEENVTDVAEYNQPQEMTVAAQFSTTSELKTSTSGDITTSLADMLK